MDLTELIDVRGGRSMDDVDFGYALRSLIDIGLLRRLDVYGEEYECLIVDSDRCVPAAWYDGIFVVDQDRGREIVADREPEDEW